MDDEARKGRVVRVTVHVDGKRVAMFQDDDVDESRIPQVKRDAAAALMIGEVGTSEEDLSEESSYVDAVVQETDLIERMQERGILSLQVCPDQEVRYTREHETRVDFRAFMKECTAPVGSLIEYAVEKEQVLLVSCTGSWVAFAEDDPKLVEMREELLSLAAEGPDSTELN